ncbi:MAG: 4Fe-4S dicluster domain-containing protein [Gemmatimonadota bacterium]
MKPLVPASQQPPLPADRMIVREAPDEEAVPMDVLFVGGGPAGLAGAIELARLVAQERENGGPDLEIGVLEKSGELGEHCLSGAVVNPEAFHELFPDLPVSELPFRGGVPGDRVHMLTAKRDFRLPTPPTMRNHGHYVASICEIVGWLGARAEEAGVNVFTGFPADSLLMDGDRVVGVRTTPAGLDRDGHPGSGFMPPTDLTARVTVLAEGTRGPLSAAWLDDQKIGADNPQIFALGVKELWQVPGGLDAVIHTLGWPLPREAFGGSFIYPMGPDLIAVGLVVGLDAPFADLDVHAWLQALKTHPFVARRLAGGELVEWGAKTIPEGGYHSIPRRLHGDGLVVVGDAAGVVDVATLKGIHYAMWSGIYAARTIHASLWTGDGAAASLSSYDTALHDRLRGSSLYRNRNMRLAFKSGFYGGGVRAGMMQLTRGVFPAGRIEVKPDASEPRTSRAGIDPSPDGTLTHAKLDAVFRSGNATRDDIPSHLVVGDDVSPEMAAFYERLCPAGVYEVQDGNLVVNAPNCVDCKATDVVGPRWTPREGGSGPVYKRM